MPADRLVEDATPASPPMEFGLFHEFSTRQGASQAQAFAEGFDLVDAAEAWGLDAVWLAELHFEADRSVLASPLTIAAAIAARTERVKVGTAVQVLPLGDPLRLAEDAASVDQISRGRLIFGVGRSGLARSYDAYGVPYGESRARMAESLEIICKAWTEPSFSYAGQYYHYENVSLVPKPYQTPYPPVRVAATSADTYPAIGSQGYPLFVAVRLGTFDELVPAIQAYHDAYHAAGHAGDGAIYLRVPIYIAETAERALAEPQESILQFYRRLGAQISESAAHTGTREIEQRAERGQRLQSFSYERALREKIVVGTPDMVIERLRELRKELGLSGILAELNCGGLIPHAQVRRSLQLLCDEVAPCFR